MDFKSRKVILQKKINAYPNPADQFINFTIEQLNSALIEITDNTGRIIHKEETTTNSVQINSTKFVSGLYFIKINIKNKIYYSKVAVQH